MANGSENQGKSAGHFGKCELRELMDFIYGGPPTSEEQKLFGAVPVYDNGGNRVS